MKPTKATVAAIKEDLMRDLNMVRRRIEPLLRDPEFDRAWHGVESFCCVGLRIVAKTNPSKIRDVARSVEIATHLAGRPVLSDE